MLDMGVNMIRICKAVEHELAKDGHHYVTYLTDMPGLMCVEEISEDEFLDHFKKLNNGKT